MPVQYMDPIKRGFLNIQAVDKVRLRIPESQVYLNLSGTNTTTDLNWSWLGHRHQAQTLRERALARGEDWPFEIVHRSETDSKRKENQ